MSCWINLSYFNELIQQDTRQLAQLILSETRFVERARNQMGVRYVYVYKKAGTGLANYLGKARKRRKSGEFSTEIELRN